MPKLSLRRKDGQVSVLVAVSMALIMVIAAFAIDIAHVFVQKRHAQNAADAAALASGRYLPLNGSACDASQWNVPGTCAYQISQTAQQYSSLNGGPNVPFPECAGASSYDCFVTPYKGHNDRVQIRIREDVRLWFAGVVPGLAGALTKHGAGCTGPCVTAKAVGTPGGTFSTTTTPGITTPGTTIYGTTNPGTTINGTTVFGTTNAGTTIAGTTNPGTTIAGTTNGGTTIAGTTNAGTVSTTYSSTTITNLTGTGGGSGGAMFAMSTACPAFRYGGTAKTFGAVGAVVSNGGALINGDSGKTITSLAVGTKNTCYTNTAATILNPPVVGPFSPQNWPVPPPPQSAYTPPNCTAIPIPAGSTTVSFSKTGHPPGSYCVVSNDPTVTLTFSTKGADWTGYTFYAPSISISGGNQTFATGPQQTVLDAYLGDLSIQGGGGGGNSVTGYMFAPNGQASLQGGGVSAGSGYIEAQTISVTGNSASYTGSGPGGSFGTQTVTQTVTTFTTTPGTTNSGTTVAGTTNSGTTVAGTTNSGSTVAGTTNSGSTTPGTTSTGFTNPGLTQTGATTPGSTQTQTTGTTVALDE